MKTSFVLVGCWCRSRRPFPRTTCMTRPPCPRRADPSHTLSSLLILLPCPNTVPPSQPVPGILLARSAPSAPTLYLESDHNLHRPSPAQGCPTTGPPSPRAALGSDPPPIDSPRVAVGGGLERWRTAASNKVRYGPPIGWTSRPGLMQRGGAGRRFGAWLPSASLWRSAATSTSSSRAGIEHRARPPCDLSCCDKAGLARIRQAPSLADPHSPTRTRPKLIHHARLPAPAPAVQGVRRGWRVVGASRQVVQ